MKLILSPFRIRRGRLRAVLWRGHLASDDATLIAPFDCSTNQPPPDPLHKIFYLQRDGQTSLMIMKQAGRNISPGQLALVLFSHSASSSRFPLSPPALFCVTLPFHSFTFIYYLFSTMHSFTILFTIIPALALSVAASSPAAFRMHKVHRSHAARVDEHTHLSTNGERFAA